MSLIKRLPHDSAFARAASPDAAELGRWGPTDYLLAELFDLTARAHFTAPKPYPRPQDVITQRNDEAARLAAMQEQAQRSRDRTTPSTGSDG